MLSVPLYFVLVVFTTVCFAVFCVVFAVAAPLDRDRRAVHRVSQWWSRAYFRLVPTWRVRVEGLENIPREPCVIVANHRSMVDIVVMFFLPVRFRWVAKREVYRWPVFGWVLRMRGDIAIERGSARAVREMARRGGQCLARGMSVVVFPEGSRGHAGELGRFREGAFMLARSAGVAVLPCVIGGTDSATRGWRLNFRNVFSVRVLPPVPADEVAGTDTATLARRVREMINEKL